MDVLFQILNSGVTIPAKSEHRGSVILDKSIKTQVIVSITWDDFHHDICKTLTVLLTSSEDESIGPDDIDRYAVNLKLRSISIDVSNYKVWEGLYVSFARCKF